MNINIGDVVRLKSGSLYMTVERIRDSGMVCCIWFSEEGVVKTYEFTPESLVVHTP